ncbi:NIPSNAP family containing protein [Flavilitoribacter nigricans DSM 23189 = NBRC 102662]|uniref:NIPSNAP family containing protein n=2 Tax=Flavilitoribacter TaxID=2762562 RepID=A0A2D0N3P1_FLAN2|nr:NIPSNAP family containing protein [Flavilitoribacter nigricans DSM 23189 = NBRC 102662]
MTMTSCANTPPETPEEATSTTAEREFYQLKVYTFDTDEQVAMTDNYLRDAFMPALKKRDIGPIGVFKQIPGENDSTRRTYVLIPFSSLEEVVDLEAALGGDNEYQTTGSEYVDAAHDHPPYRRIESTLMQAFVDMPQMEPSGLENPRSERIYELRSYESPTEQYYHNKVDMFNAGGEIKLFDRLNFNAVFYAEVISGSKMPNLMYMTTFSDMASRDEKWKAFFDAPEWKELVAMEKYKNNVSHADIIFLSPTEYSDY